MKWLRPLAAQMSTTPRAIAMLSMAGAALCILSFLSTSAAPPRSAVVDSLLGDVLTPVADVARDARSEPADTGTGKSAGRIEGYLAGGRWREGSKLVDVLGQFKISGDRVAFVSNDGKSRFACLENLNSERVARIVSESPEALQWVVQGTITEFRHENYLLVTQAVIRARATRSAQSSGER